MSTPVIGNLAQVKLPEISNHLDIQNGVNMVWPTGIPNQQENGQSYLVEPPIQETSRQVQFHQFVNWRPGQPLNYNSSSHQYFAAYTRSPNYVMTDPRRIQGMETTIEYLRELLMKEFSNNVKEKTVKEEMKKELEDLNEKNKLLQEQLQTAVMSIKELQSERREINCVVEDVDAQKTLSANHKELLNAQSELVIAQNIIDLNISELNTLLDSKVTELSQVNDELVSNLSLESENVSECVERSMSAEEKDVAALKMEYELLKDELIATTEKKNIISNQFKELGKKYLYIIEYSGQQMYDEYVAKHVEFIQKLENLKSSASETQSSKIKQMLACLQGQVELLEEFRENFRVTIELLMCRIDQEFALVSDLSIRATKPSFEIPLEDFDLLFQVISGIGSVELDGELNA